MTKKLIMLLPIQFVTLNKVNYSRSRKNAQVVFHGILQIALTLYVCFSGEKICFPKINK